MNKVIKTILPLVASIAFLGACENQKAADSGPAPMVVPDMNGDWKTELMSFETDRCAMKVALSNDGVDFVLNDFTVACVNGGTEGLYVPLRMKIRSRNLFQASELEGIGGSSTSSILALEQEEGVFKPRGWIDLSNPMDQQFEIAIRNWDLPVFNEIRFKAGLKPDGSLEISKVGMLDGWSVDDAVRFTKAKASTTDFVFAKSAWDKMRLPANAELATSLAETNYLYCVDRKFPNTQGVVDLTRSRYSVSGGSIGELGFIDRTGENRVVMWGTNYGSRRQVKGFVEYSVGVTGPGGRTNSFRFAYSDTGYGYLATGNGYSRYLCRAVVGDVFYGLPGWNP